MSVLLRVLLRETLEVSLQRLWAGQWIWAGSSQRGSATSKAGDSPGKREAPCPRQRTASKPTFRNSPPGPGRLREGRERGGARPGTCPATWVQERSRSGSGGGAGGRGPGPGFPRGNWGAGSWAGPNGGSALMPEPGSACSSSSEAGARPAANRGASRRGSIQRWAGGTPVGGAQDPTGAGTSPGSPAPRRSRVSHKSSSKLGAQEAGVQEAVRA